MARTCRRVCILGELKYPHFSSTVYGGPAITERWKTMAYLLLLSSSYSTCFFDNHDFRIVTDYRDSDNDNGRGGEQRNKRRLCTYLHTFVNGAGTGRCLLTLGFVVQPVEIDYKRSKSCFFVLGTRKLKTRLFVL